MSRVVQRSAPLFLCCVDEWIVAVWDCVLSLLSLVSSPCGELRLMCVVLCCCFAPVGDLIVACELRDMRVRVMSCAACALRLSVSAAARVRCCSDGCYIWLCTRAGQAHSKLPVLVQIPLFSDCSSTAALRLAAVWPSIAERRHWLAN